VQSTSYIPGAPNITADGNQMTLVLTVLVPGGDGYCRRVSGALVEIWHNGDRPQYSPDQWRTALVTDETAMVRYATIRPTSGEADPHFHVRVSLSGLFGSSSNEWVLGVLPSTPETLELALILDSSERRPADDSPSSGV
jgi:hypothetical protein